MCGSAVTRFACDPPLGGKIRREPDGSLTLMQVSSGAMVLEGDELTICLRLTEGARVTVTSMGAQLIHPCLDGGWATVAVDATVGGGSSLRWHPEPVIVAASARYRSRVTLDCGDDALLHWTDELVLGRSGEDPTDLALDSTWRLDVAGRPRWRDGLATGPGWTGPAVLGTARYVAAEVAVGPGGTGRGPSPIDTGPVGRGGCGGPAGSAPAGPQRAMADPDPFSSGWPALAGGGFSRRTLAGDPVAGRRVLRWRDAVSPTNG